MKRILVLLLFFCFLTSCTKDESTDTDQTARISIHFKHHCDAQPLRIDSMMYLNAANNPFLVNEIQYFISDVCLYKHGEVYLLDAWKDIHYVDTDLPSSWIWEIRDSIKPATYDSLSFIFGISEAKNQSLHFVNPPESNMFWPEYLGGGYHYLKLNGKWEDSSATTRPFNFHMGIGQLYDENTGEPIEFIQNYFMVVPIVEPFIFEENETLILELEMEVLQWFENPAVFDFNQWGGDIMQKQQAILMARNNGKTVFKAHWIAN